MKRVAATYFDKTNAMKLPEVIFVEVFDQASEKFEKSLTFSISKEGKIYTYILDSITLTYEVLEGEQEKLFWMRVDNNRKKGKGKGKNKQQQKRRRY